MTKQELIEKYKKQLAEVETAGDTVFSLSSEIEVVRLLRYEFSLQVCFLKCFIEDLEKLD